ncbi:MAG: SDR family oxidoreductase [Actinomycetota bacterium]|nr:SDR family oxidoreductase [Actinomycetota bacterium]
MSKWALVTGATAGIGESFTRLLASKGFNIALVARDEARLHQRAAALREKYGVQTFVLPADLATDQGCSSVEEYLKEFEIEVLINNAGFGINKAFTMSALDAEQDLLDVLVRTPMRLMHVVLPQMKARNSGTIINVSSIASFIAGGTYSASKSYLTVLSESLHTELRATNIKISALCPGFTRTEFHERGRMKMKGLPEFMWLDSDQLVAQSWSDAQSGKAVSVPGWQYKLLVDFIATLPRRIVRSIGMNLRKR